MLIQVISALVTISLLYCFIPLFKLYGAVLALFSGSLLRFILFFWRSQKAFFIPYSYARIIGFFTLTVMSAFVVMEYSNDNTLFTLAIRLILFWLFIVIGGLGIFHLTKRKYKGLLQAKLA